ncbi:MAG: hypothetical protein AAGF75_14440, partial [Cyanobacteria bacterium P01_H01_bin.130]
MAGRTDEVLRSLGQAAELRRLMLKGRANGAMDSADPNAFDGDGDADANSQNSYSYSYQGLRRRRHWVRRNDGRWLSGNLATNGAIAIGARV